MPLLKGARRNGIIKRRVSFFRLPRFFFDTFPFRVAEVGDLLEDFFPFPSKSERRPLKRGFAA